MFTLGENSATATALKAGEDGVVPGAAGSSATHPNFLTFSEVEIGKLILL
jgi:hypothetical protein